MLSFDLRQPMFLYSILLMKPLSPWENIFALQEVEDCVITYVDFSINLWLEAEEAAKDVEDCS